MKIYSGIALIGLLILCTACPPRQYDTDLKRLQDNGMDFPDLERQYFEGITFMLSDMFGYNYDDDFVLSEISETKVIHQLDISFSVELFNSDDAEAFQYAFDEEIDLLNAVHDSYVIKRQESLFENASSIKKPLPESVGYDGYIQVVNGDAYTYGEGSSYFTATLQIEDQFFVFQLIGKQANMGYLYDDFIDILSSVEG